MADHISISTPVQGSPSRISWGSVIAGAVVASAVMFTLCELCMAFGLGLLKPQDPSKDASVPTMAMAGVIAWVASAVIATFVGAWAAGHLARQRNETDSVLHGLMVWGIGIVAMVTIGATAAGVLVGGAFSLVGAGMHATGAAIGGMAHGAGSALGGAARGVGAALGGTTMGQATSGMPAFNWDSIRYKAESLLKQNENGQANGRNGEAATGTASNQNPNQSQNQSQNQNQNQQGQPTQNGAQPTTNDQGASTAARVATNPAAGADRAPQQDGTNATGQDGRQAGAAGNDGAAEHPMALIGRVFGNPSGTISDSDRSALVSMLTAHTSLSQADATKQVQQWEQAAQQAREQYEQLKTEAEQKARAAAAATAKALSDAAWVAFVATILAASAAMLGAHLGGPRNTSTRDYPAQSGAAVPV